MYVVCAPDSFKGSLTAAEAAAALAQGVQRAVPGAECAEVPMSDGGEGFRDALSSALGGRNKSVTVHSTLGERIDATFALVETAPSQDRDVSARSTTMQAIIEVASAVGLDLVDEPRRDIRRGSSYGVGELILAALDAGATEILIGLGGSGTSDGGAGMLRALGMRFLDTDGVDLDGSPEELSRLEKIDASSLDPRLCRIRIRVACDVDNPLTGPNGAAAIYGPQKGASPEDVVFLDHVLARFADCLVRESDNLEGLDTVPGAGAAGGLGYALLYLGAVLESGVELVEDAVHLPEKISHADVVFTGEGHIDRQTLMGKALSGIAKIAHGQGVPIVAFGGLIDDGVESFYESGFDALVPITDRPGTLSETMRRAAENLSRAAETATRLLQL